MSTTLSTKPNRVLAAVAKYKARIDKLSLDSLKSLDDKNQWDFDEFYSMQNLKTIAQLNQTITYDEAMTIYNYLGEAGPDRINNQPLEVRLALTILHGELLVMSR